MKKEYIKPCLEIEVYSLDAAIAAGCTNIISLGPEMMDKTACDEYKGGFGEWSLRTAEAEEVTTPFYPGACSCEYTSGGITYVTS